VNGKPDSATVGDLPTTVLLGALPALLAESPRRAFVVGFGTGVTAGELRCWTASRKWSSPRSPPA